VKSACGINKLPDARTRGELKHPHVDGGRPSHHRFAVRSIRADLTNTSGEGPNIAASGVLNSGRSLDKWKALALVVRPWRAELWELR